MTCAVCAVLTRAWQGDEFRETLYPLLGDGIFNTNGSNWKQQRQTASHLFKVRELRSMVPIFVQHGQEVRRNRHARTHMHSSISSPVTATHRWWRF
jgi:cytochrome P450